MERRDALKMIGLGGIAIPASIESIFQNSENIELEKNPRHVSLQKAITAITLGTWQYLWKLCNKQSKRN